MYCFSIFIARARGGPWALNGTQEAQLQKNRTQAAALPLPLSASHLFSTNRNLPLWSQFVSRSGQTGAKGTKVNSVCEIKAEEELS